MRPNKLLIACKVFSELQSILLFSLELKIIWIENRFQTHSKTIFAIYLILLLLNIVGGSTDKEEICLHFRANRRLWI